MMTSSNGSIFRVTGPLCGEFTGPRWIPHTKASDAELWCFLWSTPNKRLSKQMQGWWFETHSPPLWRHSNDKCTVISLPLRVSKMRKYFRMEETCDYILCTDKRVIKCQFFIYIYLANCCMRWMPASYRGPQNPKGTSSQLLLWSVTSSRVKIIGKSPHSWPK